MKRGIIALFLLITSHSFASEILITFRNDDISAKSDPVYEYKVLQVFRKYEIKPLFAVIPAIGENELSSEMSIVDSLKSWYNKDWIDLAMHGYTHEKKFLGMSYEEQNERISKGKQILNKSLGLDINWFAPPWNAVDRNTLKVLKNNNISNFSGYLGETEVQGITYINCNCNLFDGPLDALSDKIDLAIESKDDVLLVALYHTSYDFNSNSLEQLDSLLNYISSLENVKILSFSQLLNNQSYSEVLQESNIAGYYLKNMKYNKYIRKIVLNIPVVSNYVIKYISLAEELYWKGNYHSVNKLYTAIMTKFWILIFIIIVLASFTIIIIYRKIWKNNK